MARKKLLTEGEIRQFMKLANLRPVNKARLSEMGGQYPGQRDDEMEMGAEEEVAVDDLGGDEMEMEMGAEEEIAPAPDGEGAMVSMDDFMTALEQAIEEVTGEEADVSEEPGGEEEEEVEMDMEMDPAGGAEEMEMGAEEEIMAEILRRLREETDADKMRAKRDKMKKAEEREKEAKKAHAKGKGKKGFMDESEDLEEVHYGFTGGRREPKMKAPRRTGPAVGFGEPDPEEEEESEMLPGTDPADDPPRPRRPRKAGRRSAPGVKMPAFGMEERVVNEVAKRVVARLRQNGRKEQMVDQLAERIMKRLTK